ncbi:MAG: MFS transporter [Leptolyngbyaceae cyanobacterium bins.349]|nr:MFS transporter [Leptolyngbyaceae cyanobacterium bins.349]
MTPKESAGLRPPNPLLSALQLANRQIWLQALGRSLCQIGSGLIYFYIPLVFVNQIGLSAASVGFSVGLSSLTGIVGHILGGVLADAPRFGRKTTLIFSGGLGALVALTLAFTQALPLLIVASLLLGLSVGFYWTAADAAVMDVTEIEARSQAFALMSVAENLGNGVGILGGGLLLATVNQSAQLLFMSCSLIFLVFVLMVSLTMPETRQVSTVEKHSTTGLLVALRDKSLLIFILANLLFTTYIALVTSTIPLYFTNFVPAISGGVNASVASTASLFTWCYIGAGAVLQLPIAQLFKRFSRVRVLMMALGLWAVGFSLVWVTGTVTVAQSLWGIAALIVMALASITYKPFAAAIVSELAPPSLRGAYIAVSSQCWAIGYFIGPTLGGWAMDQSAAIAHRSWLVAAATTVVGLVVLMGFNRVYAPGSRVAPVDSIAASSQA